MARLTDFHRQQRQPFIDYIREQKVPTDKNLAEKHIRRAKSYILV
jgi:hypothetical protein